MFSGDTPVDIQLVTLLYVFNVKELSSGEKTKKSLIIIISCKIHSIQFNLIQFNAIYHFFHKLNKLQVFKLQK